MKKIRLRATIAANVVILLFTVIFIFTRSYGQQVENRKDAVESSYSTLASFESVVDTFLENQQDIADAWATYINASKMTMDEAISYISMVNTDNDANAHILNAYTYEGFSTKNKYSTNSVSYKHLFLTYGGSKQGGLFDCISENIRVSLPHNDPMTNKIVVAFYNEIALVDENMEPVPAILLRTIPVVRLKDLWSYPSSELYEKAQNCLINRDGSYILKNSYTQGTDFFSFLEKYNTDPEFIAQITSQIQSDNKGEFVAFSSVGEKMFVVYQAITTNSHWLIMTMFPESALDYQSMDMLPLMIISGALVLLLLVDLLHLKSERKKEIASQQAMAEKIRMISRQEYLVNDALEQSRGTNDDLALTVDMAQQANRAKTVFLNSMSHDIRTPMNAIMGFTNLAIRHIDTPQLVLDYMKKIERSSQHLLSLINDVLDMSRIESGNVTLQTKLETLASVFHDIQDMFFSDMEKKSLRFTACSSGVEHEWVYCDKLRLNQILLNIISNAMKYTPNGGSVNFTLVEEQGTTDNERDYVFTVRDSGIGMSKDFLKTIFEPFTREKTSTVSGIQGTGLGMSITQSLVKLMDGQIYVESELNVGTTVTLRFTFTVPEKKEQTGLEGKKVWISSSVDDSVCALLESGGMQVENELQSCDFALLDEADPVNSDLENSGITFFILTNNADIVEEEEEEQTNILQKPLFLSDLAGTVSRAAPRKDKQDTFNFTGMHVLLVEDNELNREIAVEILEEAGFIVDTAEDGNIAVEKMENQNAGTYSVILMDIQMPTMNGYDATRAIRALEDNKKSSIPIIAMTANAFEEDRNLAFEAGMNAHIAKPFKVDVLFRTISTLVETERKGKDSTW